MWGSIPFRCIELVKNNIISVYIEVKYMSRLTRKLEETDLEIDDLYDYDDDSIEDKTFTPEEEKRRRIQHIATVIAMVLVVAVIGSSIAMNPKDDKKKTSTKKPVVEQSTISAEAPTEATGNTLNSEQYPEITELVQLYYQARLTGDTASIQKYVDNIEDVDMNQVKASNEYIKKYKNIECYTKIGLEENAYVVFARYDIKFKNIETLAPGIDVFYVIRDEETGSVFIHNGATANTDIKTYIEALEQESDVMALYEEVNVAFQEALNADASLNEFYTALTQGTVNANSER